MLRSTFYLFASIFIIISCSSHTGDGDGHDHSGSDDLTEEETTLFTNQIKPLVESKCSSCHTTGSEANFLSGNIVKSHIDEIIRRDELNPTEADFMPRNGAKLSADEINQIKSWKMVFDKNK